MEYLAEILLALIVIIKTVSGVMKWRSADPYIEKAEKIINELIRLFKIEKR